MDIGWTRSYSDLTCFCQIILKQSSVVSCMLIQSSPYSFAPSPFDASMKKMGDRLQNVLYESLNYSNQDLEDDLNEIKKEMPDIIDVEFTEV